MSEATAVNISRTINIPAMKKAQKVHAIAVVMLSALGFFLAAILAFYGYYPGMTEWVLMTVFFVIGGLGISIGYHRFLTHQSFKAHPAIKVMLAIMGSMSMQGTLLFWVALHRRHHELSDKPGDPHSPYIMEDGSPISSSFKGILHSYIMWSFDHSVPNSAYYARDLMKDSTLSVINRLYFFWVFLGLLLPALIGLCVYGHWIGALQGFIWGGAIRIFLGHNKIWCITSLTHIFGSRDFNSRDKSTNNFLLSFFTLGESWHNNHHAFPRAAILQFRWYQIDISGYFILLLEKVGLVSNVHRPTKNMLMRKSK